MVVIFFLFVHAESPLLLFQVPTQQLNLWAYHVIHMLQSTTVPEGPSLT